mgnify:CR=1 FL=1
MEVEVSGILSLSESDIGTIQVFYDINKAEEEGHFWKAQEMHFALGMLASGLDLEGQAWEDHVYHPTKWSDDGIARTKAA